MHFHRSPPLHVFAVSILNTLEALSRLNSDFSTEPEPISRVRKAMQQAFQISVRPEMQSDFTRLVLINGFQGIGTGWATQGPNFDPLEAGSVPHVSYIGQYSKPASKRVKGILLEIPLQLLRPLYAVFCFLGPGGGSPGADYPWRAGTSPFRRVCLAEVKYRNVSNLNTRIPL